MTTHTPGPWRLKESPHKREFSYFLDAGLEIGSYFIAAVNNGTGPDDANARLIAAAPELLDCCTSVLAECMDTYHDPDDMAPEWKALCEDLRAAIAKATGQQ